MRGEQMEAGEQGIVQAKLAEPLLAGPGDRFIIRTLSPIRTIGGGMMVEPVSHRIRRNQPDILPDLAERAEAVREEQRFVEYCVRNADELATPEADLARRAKVPAERLPDVLEQLIREQKVIRLAGGLCIHRETAEEVGRRLLGMVGDFHRESPPSPGMTAEQFHQASGLSKEVGDGMIELLESRGRLVRRNHRLALAEHRETFTEDQQQLLHQIEALFIKQPFKPPDLEEIAGHTGRPGEKVREGLKILAEHQHLVQVAPGLLFHRQAIDRARDVLVSYIHKQGKLESVKFKYLLDTTRKFAIPLLDYFDRTGVTRRQNNTRYLRQPRTPQLEG
jgi:selenocysteine-specific elongation factor